MVKENEFIDSILVQNFKNEQINLIKQYKGKPLLAIIYNNQCLACTGRAIPLAYELQKEHKEIQVVGIHTSFNGLPVSKSDVKSIFTLNELPFPIFLDLGGTVYDQFNSLGTPQWVLVTKDGLLARTIFGSQDAAKNRLSYALQELI